VPIESQSDAAVAEFGEDDDGIFEPMMGEAIGVVAEKHGRSTGIQRYSTSLAWTVVRPRLRDLLAS
jgi:hypothetical protein